MQTSESKGTLANIDARAASGIRTANPHAAVPALVSLVPANGTEYDHVRAVLASDLAIVSANG
jgi:hypothetical protein